MKKAPYFLALIILIGIIGFVSAIECTDSDGGKNFYVKGTTTGCEGVSGCTIPPPYNPITTQTDRCDSTVWGENPPNANNLVEFYCVKDYYTNPTNRTEFLSMVFTCPYGCSNGACLTAYPACSPSWSCTDWSACTNNQQTRNCVDFNSCSNNLTGKPIESQICTNTPTCIENWHCSSWSTCTNSQQSRTCTDSNSCGTTTSKPTISQSCTSSNSQSCVDTDGGFDYYHKGTTYNLGRGTTIIDSCCTDSSDIMCGKSFGKFVGEAYCTSNGDPNSNSPYECTYGCYDGRCLTETESHQEQPRCIDSDGGLDYYILGNITTVINDRPIFLQDSCLNSSELIETYCLSDGLYYGSEKYACSYGCSNGICLNTAITNPINSSTTTTVPNIVDNEINTSTESINNSASCEPIGLRKSGKYCSSDNILIEEKNTASSCENNFECQSNVCAGGKCISEGFIQKILNWFRRLFGMS